MKKALAIIVSDRVEYFKQMATSLAQVVKDGYDYYFFIDEIGRKCVDQYKQILSDVGISGYRFMIAEQQLGCCKNIVMSRQFLFDYYDYDFVVYSDDDVIFAKSFLVIHTKMLEWGKANYDNIGLIGVWNDWPYDKKPNLNLVYGNTNASMTCGLTKECWLDISSEIMQYVRFRGDDTTQRRTLEAAEYIYNRFLKIKQVRSFQKPLTNYFDWEKSVADTKGLVHCGQDMMFPVAINRLGWCGLTSVVNRCINIGKEGVHCSADTWDNSSIAKVTLDEFEEDFNITDFKLFLG